jgi:hypothetical protein
LGYWLRIISAAQLITGWFLANYNDKIINPTTTCRKTRRLPTYEIGAFALGYLTLSLGK